MKKYALYIAYGKQENNAGPKAVNDALEISNQHGFEKVCLYKVKNSRTTIFNLLTGYLKIFFWGTKFKKGDIIFLQYPINRVFLKRVYKILNRRKVHTVTLIHDIDYLRNVPLGNKGVQAMKDLELSLLNQSSYLICHNPIMIEKLEEANIQSNCVSLGIFDYLYSGNDAVISKNKNQIIIAGNLLKKKAGYLYKLNDKEHQFGLSLYGSNLDEGFQYSHAIHYGSFSPNELIGHLNGAFGLVWDGTNLDCCDGDYGNYLRINNPHKASLYLAAGLPLIVWRESALASFIQENEVGICVDSLNQLDQEFSSEKWDYSVLQHNVKVLQEKVRNGSFLSNALSKVEKLICAGDGLSE